MKTVSVVLGSYNRAGFLKLAIDSIRRELSQSSLLAEIIVVDGGSTDGTLNWLAQQKDIVTIIQHNRGEWLGTSVAQRSWGYFMNLGFKCAQGKFVCMLSDDCLVVPGAIQKGISLFEESLANGEKVGAVAFYWRNWPEQRTYRVGLTLGDRMFVNHGLYLNEALERVSYCDEDSYRFYHADGDLCLKLWQSGYRCIESPDSFIEHFSHANMAVRQSNAENIRNDWTSYLKKWEGIFYNPDEHNIGGWKEICHTDVHATAELFKRAAKQNVGITRNMQKILKTIRRTISTRASS